MQLMMVKAKLETRTRTRKMEKLEKDWSISTIADLQEDMTRSVIFIYIATTTNQSLQHDQMNQPGASVRPS